MENDPRRCGVHTRRRHTSVVVVVWRIQQDQRTEGRGYCATGGTGPGAYAWTSD